MAKKIAKKEESDIKEDKTCGIIMPISEIDGCTQQHWKEVLAIISDAADRVDFNPKLVSDNKATVVLQNEIVTNLYHNPIVVCDVSGKNPNVMFELGMRLAFDKPTILIKDEKTNYSFDTSPIAHLEYPRDLRHPLINKFIQNLAETIKLTVEESKKSGYSSYMKNFGDIEITNLQNKEIPIDDYLKQTLEKIESKFSSIDYLMNFIPNKSNPFNANAVHGSPEYKGRKKSRIIRLTAPSEIQDSSSIYREFYEGLENIPSVLGFKNNVVEGNEFIEVLMNPHASLDDFDFVKNYPKKFVSSF